MKKLLIFSLALSVSLLSCRKETCVDIPEGEGTRVVLVPSAFGFDAAGGTRAVNLDDTDDGTHPDYYYNGFLGAPPLVNLPIGTTLWLTYRKGTPVNPSGDLEDPDNFTWDDMDLHAYVVQNAAGYNALYPIDSEDVDIDGVTYMKTGDLAYSSPLFLADGYYQFRMVCPANLIRKDNLMMQVDNGMYVYANDERYEQTRSSIIHIQADASGVQNIVLNPMINQTARFKVSVSPGTDVDHIDMMSQGVEIAGVQNPELNAGGEIEFKWNSMELADTLKMKKGDKYCRVFIKDFERNGNVITGDVGILPTDAMSTTTVVTVNVAVNGIPTQYTVVLNRMRYFHGHSYNLDLELGLDGDIRVMNWASQSWLGEMNFL